DSGADCAWSAGGHLALGPCPEPANSSRIVSQRGFQVVGIEVGPQRVGDEHLRIRTLPEQEVAHAPFTGGTDDQVRIREVRVVHVRRDGRLVDFSRPHSLPDQLFDRINDLCPSTVIETYVEDAVRVVRGARHRLFDALTHSGRQVFAAAADHDAHSPAVHLVDLTLHRLVEETHQGTDLRPWARPVLGRERVDRERVHAEVLASLEHAFDRADAGSVTKAGRPALAAGQAPVPSMVIPEWRGAWGVTGGGESYRGGVKTGFSEGAGRAEV